MNDRTALFPGTFDPYTNGHLDLTRRAARLFERVVVAVAHNPAKSTMFTPEERVAMIRGVTKSLRQVEVIDFSGLVVDCARQVGAAVMIRGLRAVSDFEFEFQMALMNRKLSPALEVAYLMPSQEYTYLNSTLVKEVARFGGSIRGLVPRITEDALRARLGARHAGATVNRASAAGPAGAKRPGPGAGRGAGAGARRTGGTRARGRA